MRLLALLLAATAATHVLVATYGVEGPVSNGGIATFSTAIVQLLKVVFLRIFAKIMRKKSALVEITRSLKNNIEALHCDCVVLGAGG